MQTWLKAILLSALAVFAPVHQLLVVALVLVVVDSATGMWAALKSGDTLTSAKASRAFAKGMVYTIGIGVGFLVEHYMLGDVLAVSKLAAGAIGVTECISIFENLNKISGTNVLQAAIDKLSSANLPKN